MIEIIIKILSSAILMLFVSCNTSSNHIEIDDFYKYDFDLAIDNRSSAPNFILITVVDDNTNEQWDVCLPGGSLVWAIIEEHKDDFKKIPQSRREAHMMAKKNKNRIFHFTNPDVLKELKPLYSQKILDEVEKELSSYTIDQIIAGLSNSKNNEIDLYERYITKRPLNTYTHAYAHTLIKRGLACGRGCYAPTLFLGTIPKPEKK